MNKALMIALKERQQMRERLQHKTQQKFLPVYFGPMPDGEFKGLLLHKDGGDE